MLSILDGILGLGGRVGTVATTAPGNVYYGAGVHGGVLTNIFSLAILIPNLSVSVRRLHDTDRSGWWILMPMIPYAVGFGALISGGAAASIAVMILGGVAMFAGLICAIVLLVWYCSSGTVGPNRFGDDPKADIPADLAATFE